MKASGMASKTPQNPKTPFFNVLNQYLLKMKAFFVIGAAAALRFVDEADEIESTGQRMAQ